MMGWMRGWCGCADYGYESNISPHAMSVIPSPDRLYMSITLQRHARTLQKKKKEGKTDAVTVIQANAPGALESVSVPCA